MKVGVGFVALVVGAIIVILVMELGFRAFWEGPDGFKRYRLRIEMNLERWSFLSSREKDLETETMLGTFRPYSDYEQEPELDRPPFDRVPVSYRIVTNGEGFRERPFEWNSLSPLVLVVGDSVTFGKGVTDEERFTRMIESRLPTGSRVYALAIPGCASDCISRIARQFMGMAPDLLLLQASTNDIDLSLWRESKDFIRVPLWMARLALVSRLATAAAYFLRGDQSEDMVRLAEESAMRRYGADLSEVFDTAARMGVRVAVFQVPMADGRHYRHALVDACERRREVCHGVMRLDMVPCAFGLSAQWVTDTASSLGIAEDVVRRQFPLAPCFFDVVHPNALGNALIADQLLPFVADLVAARDRNDHVE